MRAGMVLLGLALGIVWIVGLSYDATRWLTWLDFIVAVVSLCSSLVPIGAVRTLRVAPFALSLSLFVLWVVGLATHAQSWLVWWTFAFGVAYFLMGMAMGVTEAPYEQQFPGPRRI